MARPQPSWGFWGLFFWEIRPACDLWLFTLGEGFWVIVAGWERPAVGDARFHGEVTSASKSKRPLIPTHLPLLKPETQPKKQAASLVSSLALLPSLVA